MSNLEVRLTETDQYQLDHNKEKYENLKENFKKMLRNLEDCNVSMSYCETN